MPSDVTELPPLPADERIRYGDAPSQFFDVWKPAPDITTKGSAIFIHGGFWRAKYDLTHASHMCAALSAAGIAVASLEYRRVGEPGGGWPGTYEDVLAGIGAARKHLPSPPVIIGHSAGGHLGLLAGFKTSDVRAILALAPVANLRMAYDLNLSNGAVRELMGGTPDAIASAYDAACPSQHSLSTPAVVLHGTADETVPIDISRAYASARKSDKIPPELRELEGAGHMDVIDPRSEAWPEVLKAVFELLK